MGERTAGRPPTPDLVTAFVDTASTAALVASPAFANANRVEWLTGKLALNRAGAPCDIAIALLYLASDESAFMTGQSLVVDGGRLIG